MTKNNLLSLIAILLVIILGNSCKKDTGIIGLELLDDNAKIRLGVDSSTVLSTYNVLMDSILSSNNTRALIGAYTDDLVGTSSSMFVTQVKPINNNPNIEELVFDSISFDFKINKLYGDIVSEMKIELFEVTDNLFERDSLYKSDLNISAYFNHPLNRGETKIMLDTVNTDTSIISVRLNDYAVNKLVFPDGQSFNDIVANDTSFFEYFNGICIKVTHTYNPNSYFAFLKSEINALNVHFSKVDTLYANTDSMELNKTPTIFSFLITDVNGFNVFDHQYNSTINIGEDAQNDSINYIETMSGLNTVVNLEDLSKWRDSSDIIINSALLHISFDSTYVNELIPPQQLIVYQHPGEISNTVITDYSTTSGVNLVFIDNTANKYIFKITEHLQNYMLGKSDNLSIRLFPSENYSSARKVSLYSGNHHLKPKLYITYSKL